ncbi:uncharacterized protein MONOS_17943 [Monocercomonoides exilis]|uniref:uncharacterized protein n=1 Tax=Monocercomonoides exilis TaxID=2049356 RepID=UPI00355A379F|nr:hypothetical protein MONOS_17943 [Monocercomonoides exilis]
MLIGELLAELERCNEDAQKQKIEEMNEIINGMNKEEFRSVFTVELFNRIDQMIEEKKLTLENAILLTKNIGYHNVIVNLFQFDFNMSSLRFRIEKMIAEEEKKKEGENEKLLVGLCECYFILSFNFTSEMLSICVPCLLKAALNKEESEEARKEVEMALLALSSMGVRRIAEQELYFQEIKEIIQYHQEHRNLTRLAYQSAMQFLMFRIFYERSLEEVFMNELHFVREAARELDELTKCVDWERKEGENEIRRKDTKEELIILRWIRTLIRYFSNCTMWKEEFAGLINSIVQLFRAAKDNHREIGSQCVNILRRAVEYRTVGVDGLLKGGAVEAVLEEIQRQTVDDGMLFDCLQFFLNISRRLKEKEKDEKEEDERKEMKRKVFEKLEEEGYEDTITIIHEMFDFQNGKKNYNGKISLDISDYFVNA